jgi:hypothetical protein
MLIPTIGPNMEHGFTIKDAVFLILIALAIMALFSAVITIKQNVAALKNPMGVCMAQFDLNSCVCYGSDYLSRDVPITILSVNYTNYTKEGENDWTRGIN